MRANYGSDFITTLNRARTKEQKKRERKEIREKEKLNY